jgi:hypothetical protein
MAARTDVTTQKVVKDTDFAPAGTAIDQPNGMRVLFTKSKRTYILVTNTAGSTKVVTVHKATNCQDPPANDYSSTAIPATAGVGILGPFSAKYVQADSTIWLDFASGMTGAVAPFEANV